MRRHRPIHILSVCALALAIWAAPGAAAAQSSAPSAEERGIALASPGVVLIQNVTATRVRLAFPSLRSITGVSRVSRAYTFASVGTGFAVTADGAIVTAGHVVDANENQLRLRVTNELFNELLGPLGYSFDEPYTRYRITDNGQLNRMLHQCYARIICTFTVGRTVTVYRAVDLVGQELAQGMSARVLTVSGMEGTDTAVVKVDGQNMPTVALADTAGELASGDEIVAMGFAGSSGALPTGVTEPLKVFGRVSSIRPLGSTEVIELDADIEQGMSGGPVIDAEGNVIGLVSFGTFTATGESGASYLRPVDEIHAALADTGVTPQRGAVDEAFAQAMEHFWGGHYSAAIPLFRDVLSLSDGHPLAKEYLAKAQEKAGTAADVPLAGEDGGFPIWIAAVVGGVVVVALGLVMAIRRRASKAAAPAPAVPMAAVAQPMPNGARPAPQPVREHAVSAQTGAAAEAQPAPTATAVAADPHFCSNCGHGLDPGAHFCPECGQKAGA